MAIDTLSARLNQTLSWTAQDDLTGDEYNPVQNQGNLSKNLSLGTTSNNNQAGGADQLVSYIATVAANSNSTIDLTSLTNILQQTSQSFARLKGAQIRLLSTSDDATNGTNCTSITVGNASANQCNLNLSTNATMTIYSGGAWMYFDPTAAGFVAVNSSQKNLYIVNGDANVAAKVMVSLFGGSS